MPRKKIEDKPDDIFSTGLLDSLKDATSEEAAPAPEPPPVPAPKLEVVTPEVAVEKKQSKPEAPKTEKPKKQKRQAGALLKNTSVEIDNVAFKAKMTPALRKLWSDFKSDFEEALGARLDDSNVVRPLVELIICDYQEQILEAAAERRGEVSRPSNRDRVAMAEFDAVVGEVLEQGLKKRRKKSAQA